MTNCVRAEPWEIDDTDPDLGYWRTTGNWLERRWGKSGFHTEKFWVVLFHTLVSSSRTLPLFKHIFAFSLFPFFLYLSYIVIEEDLDFESLGSF